MSNHGSQHSHGWLGMQSILLNTTHNTKKKKFSGYMKVKPIDLQLDHTTHFEVWKSNMY